MRALSAENDKFIGASDAAWALALSPVDLIRMAAENRVSAYRYSYFENPNKGYLAVADAAASLNASKELVLTECHHLDIYPVIRSKGRFGNMSKRDFNDLLELATQSDSVTNLAEILFIRASDLARIKKRITPKSKAITKPAPSGDVIRKHPWGVETWTQVTPEDIASSLAQLDEYGDPLFEHEGDDNPARVFGLLFKRSDIEALKMESNPAGGAKPSGRKKTLQVSEGRGPVSALTGKQIISAATRYINSASELRKLDLIRGGNWNARALSEHLNLNRKEYLKGCKASQESIRKHLLENKRALPPVPALKKVRK